MTAGCWERGTACGKVLRVRQVGDMLWVTSPDAPTLVQDVVVAVTRVEAEGLFNPYTNEGAQRLAACTVATRVLISRSEAERTGPMIGSSANDACTNLLTWTR